MNAPSRSFSRVRPLLAIALVTVGACQTAPQAAPAPKPVLDLGTTPTTLVALADAAGPSAQLTLAVDRSGRIEHLATTRATGDLPDGITAALRRLAPGSDVLAVVEHVATDGPQFAVTVRRADGPWTAVIDARGMLVASERPIDAAAVPDAVLAAATRAVRGERTAMHEIRVGDAISYRVVTRDGALEYAAELAGDGTLVRSVRRVPAVVEVPLAADR